MKKESFFTYLTKENKEFIDTLCTKNSQTGTAIINAIIDSVRTNKKLQVKKFVPAYVKKAEEWAKKNEDSTAR